MGPKKSSTLKMLIKYFIRIIQSLDSLQAGKFAAMVAAILLLSHCSASNTRNPEFMEYDYYFADRYIQIQGRARMPAIKQNKTQSQPAKDIQKFAVYLGLEERRKLCQKEALLNAHSKWLSISEQKWASQSEWLLRLKKGALGHWGNCLTSAQIQQKYFDQPESCRLVVHYPCDPRSY